MTSGSGETLDLAAVMKASQTISGQIRLDNLLTKLMRILMIASSFIRRITTIFKCHDPAKILRQLNSVIKTSLRDRKDAPSDDDVDAGVYV